MPHYVYSDSLLTAAHRAMWTPLLLTLDIGGGRGNACEREEVLTSVLQKRRLTNEFESLCSDWMQYTYCTTPGCQSTHQGINQPTCVLINSPVTNNSLGYQSTHLHTNQLT